MKKLLSWDKPVIDSYGHIAHILSVVMHNEGYESWLYNNFTQLQISSSCNYKNIFLDYFAPRYPWMLCPWLHATNISTEDFEIYGFNIIQFLTMHLNQNHYLCLTIDMAAIKAYHNNNHSHHALLVYGYDDAEKVFYCADNFQRGYYASAQISFSEMEEAHRNTVLYQIYDITQGIWIWKPVVCKEYSFNLDQLKRELTDYLIARNSTRNHSFYQNNWDYPLVYGLDIYHVLIDFVQLHIEEPGIGDRRPFYVLKEHKKIMLRRIIYLYQSGYLDNASACYVEYKKLFELCSIVNGLWQKAIAISSRSNHEAVKAILGRIQQNLHQIKECERAAVQHLLENLHEKKLAVVARGSISYDHLSLKYEARNYADHLGNDGYPFQPGDTASFIFYGNGLQLGPEWPEGIDIACENDFMNREDLTEGYHKATIRCREPGWFKGLSILSRHPAKTSTRLLYLDTKTQGNWISRYGSAGYFLPKRERKDSDRVVMEHNGMAFIWDNDHKTDSILYSAVESAAISTAWFHQYQLEFNVITTHSQAVQIALYYYDADEVNRSMQIKFFDEFDRPLFEHKLYDFTTGIYGVYEIEGFIKIRLSRLNSIGYNTVVSGVFID